MKTDLCSSFLWLITVYYVVQGVITGVQVKVIEQNIHMVLLHCTNDAFHVVSTVCKCLNR